MPVSPTFPGVYIEEIPSGVRTIVGVATSIAAFVDFFPRGLLDEAVHIFSFADFEREFGGLDTRSEASYAIQQFFLNGGTEAYVIRVGNGALPANFILTGGTNQIFRATAGRRIRGASAVNPGDWGNFLRLEVDYDTTDPDELFNLTIAEVQLSAGRTLVRQTEVFRNLTMQPGASNAIEVVNERSRLVQLDRVGLVPALVPTTTFRPDATGTLGGPLPAPGAAPVVADGAPTQFNVTVDPGGDGVPFTRLVTLNYGGAGATIVDYATLRSFLEAAIGAADINEPLLSGASVQLVNNRFRVLLGRSGPGFNPDATITFQNAGAAATLQLSTTQGAVVSNQQIMPLVGGTLGDILPPPGPAPVVADGPATQFTVTVDRGGGGAAFTRTVTLNYGGAAASVVDYAILRPFLEAAIRTADINEPLLAGATVRLVRNERYGVLLGRGGPGFNPDSTISFQDAGAAATLQLSTAQGAVVSDQQMMPADGNLPGDVQLRGVRANKTGMYALEDVDIFNILCIPRAANLAATAMRNTYAEAEVYCEEKRAFLIVDIPQATADLDAIQTWLTQNAGLRSRNAAVYFPRVRIADPLNQSRLRSIGASGTLAGLYAQTDATRGVWKAPAGIDVRLRNVQDLDYLLTDRENGVINPLGVNALRNFPIIGLVSWGARTLDGADAQASEWKYIPVRRIALYIEESLFRGTKFAVFEPNDEPLWAQIRLNVGAFMQGLFRQGAFQGATPREAYFVKCDKETTTQADINLGIVNIVVGFAPLKPAEFVIIRIQQMAGQIPT